MRGKGASWKCLLDCKGITPAYAGKRAVQVNRETIDEDHPRLCGEKYLFRQFLSAVPGITPAYAGKSLWKRGSRL